MNLTRVQLTTNQQRFLDFLYQQAEAIASEAEIAEIASKRLKQDFSVQERYLRRLVGFYADLIEEVRTEFTIQGSKFRVGK